MAKKQAILILEVTFLLLLILAICSLGQPHSLSSNKVSQGDGGLAASDTTCKQTYGFLPCTSSAIGNLFLICVYCYFIFLAAKSLTHGSESLLEVNGYGVFGGLFLPLLCSLPGALIILASGLFGSQETAQSRASIGMGLVAGSTITLLTLLWGSCVVAGKCDLHNSIATDSSDTKCLSITGSGVMIDPETKYTAWIMVISIVPFVLVLLLQVLTSYSNLAILISLVISICLLLSYCLYQVFEPWIQHRRLAYAKYKHVKSIMLKHLKLRAMQILLTEDGEADKDALEKLFEQIDNDSDGYLSATELRALVLGIQFEEIAQDIDDVVGKVLKDFDTSGDSRVDMSEFVKGISKWVDEARHTVVDVNHPLDQPTIPEEARFKYTVLLPHQKRNCTSPLNQDQTYRGLVDESDETVESSEHPERDNSKATLTLLLGICLAAAFADPLVDAVDNFSSATGIPSFFISFVVMPFACSSEVVSALMLASRKKQRTASLVFSEIYGAVTMSNILYLSVFLIGMYVRQLTWNFSSGMIIITIVCNVIGLFASLRTIYPLWTCLVAYTLYPFSLVLVYVLDYVRG